MYKSTAFPSFCLLFLLTIVGLVIIPHFLTQSFVGGLFNAYAPIVLISVGQAVVLIGGGIDLSLGAILSIVNVFIIVLLGFGRGLPLALSCGLAVGVLCGALNGFCISYLRLNPFLATFATAWMISGLALWVMPSPGGRCHPRIHRFLPEELPRIPVPVYVIALTYFVWLILKNSPLGLQIFAVGDDVKRAYVTGVNVSRLQFLDYVFAGFTAAVGGIVMTATIGSGDPLVGSPLTLQSIAACVIGGIALTGGVGSVSGASLQSLFLGLVFTTVLTVEFSPYYQSLVSSSIILS